MTDESLKLAKFNLSHRTDELGTYFGGYEGNIEAFYRAAFNTGLEAAAKVCRGIAIERLNPGFQPECCSQVADMCNVAIRALEEK